MTFESEIFTVRDGVQAAISDVGDTTTVWDDGDDVVARPVPGHEGYEYVLWAVLFSALCCAIFSVKIAIPVSMVLAKDSSSVRTDLII